MAQRQRVSEESDTATTTVKEPRLSVLPAAPANDVGVAETAWNWHRPEAEKLSADAVQDAARVDVFRATENLAQGHAQIMAHRAQIEATGVRVDWAALARNGDLGAALRYVAQMPAPRAAAGVRDDIAALNKVTAVMRSDLANLVGAGHLGADDVGDATRSWHGPIALHAVALDLAAVCERVAPKVKGYSVVTPGVWEKARRLANDLLPRLDRTRVGDHAARLALAAARDRRNRVWTLVLRHHDQLARLGGLLWGHAVGEHVPTLGATHTRRRRAKATPPAPPTT